MFLTFFRADLVRRKKGNHLWPSSTDEEPEIGEGHPSAFFLQATARQPGRELDDSICRFDQAIELLDDEGAGPEVNVLPVLSGILRLVRGVFLQDVPAMQDSLQRLREFLDQPGAECLRDFYGPRLESVGDQPDRSAIETLLESVPHF